MSLRSKIIRLAYADPELREHVLPLLREAGVFEAPPAMMEAVTSWMHAVYAGHVLANAEKNLEGALDRLAPVRRALKELREVRDAIPEKVRGLQLGDSYKFKVYDKSWGKDAVDEAVWGVKREECNITRHDGTVVTERYVFGYGEKAVSFRSSKIPWQWSRFPSVEQVIGVYQGMINKNIVELEPLLSRDPTSTSEDGSPTADELTRLIAECKKYTSVGKTYATSTKKKFPFDVTGWKYLSALEQKEAKAKLAEAGWTDFTAILDFKGTQYKGGHWSMKDKELSVELGSGTTSRYVKTYEQADTVLGFTMGLDEVTRVARHECQHVGQDLLRVLHGMSDDAGLPSRNIRTPGFNSSGISLEVDENGKKFMRTHPLRDTEFYTRLADEIHRFKRWSPNIPPEKMKEAIKVWTAVGQDPDHPKAMKDDEGKNLSAATSFFLTLKAYEPLKWKKAVSEFVKAVT
jgi:hypothetical protein